MSNLQIAAPFPFFTEIDGSPLENGYIYIGEENLNAETNPVAVYWDAALTIQAAQPLRTIAGKIVRSGAPAKIYTQTSYSIIVKNSNGALISSSNAAAESDDAQWESVFHSPTYLSATTFKLATGDGNKTSVYHPGRNVRLNSTTYATVLSSNYNSTVVNATHVTLYWVHDNTHTAANVPNPLTAIELGPEVNLPALNLGFRYLRQFGAVPSNGESGYFDNLAVFNKALSAAYAERKSLVIDGIHSSGGKAYAISGKWTIGSSYSGMKIIGEGPYASGILNVNAAGQPAIEVDAAQFVYIDGIGIQGVSGGGHGLELKGVADNFMGRDIWVGWVDGDGYRITGAQQCRWFNCRVDINNGWRPFTKDASLTEGAIKNGIYIVGHVSNLNNDHSFIGCEIDGAQQTSLSTNYCLKVGDSTARVDSIKWIGGLIQSAADYQNVYMRTLDSVIRDTHIEPPVGATSNYLITLDRCARTSIENCSVQGDAKIIGASEGVGFEKCTMSGLLVEAEVENAYMRDCSYRNINTGPLNGYIVDKSGRLERTNLVKASDIGDDSINLSTLPLFWKTNFNHWTGGGTPTLPSGFTKTLTPTIAQEKVEGTATSGTSTTLVDSGQAWVADTLIGATVICTGGTGSGNTPATITDNDGTSVTVASWSSATPDATTTYLIVGGTVSSGPYSAKVTYTADFTEGLTVNLPYQKTAGKRVSIRARCFVQTAQASIRLVPNTGTTFDVLSQTTGQMETMEATFDLLNTQWNCQLRLSGSNGAVVYWDSLEIYIEDYAPYIFKSLADTATPEVSEGTNGNGPALSAVRLLGTTALTDIKGMEYGKPLTLIFDGSKTVPDSGNFALSAAYNATAGDTMVVVRDPTDDVIYELSRTVV